jgi:hypothetical protein
MHVNMCSQHVQWRFHRSMNGASYKPEPGHHLLAHGEIPGSAGAPWPPPGHAGAVPSNAREASGATAS